MSRTATYHTTVKWAGEHWGQLSLGNGPEMRFSAPPDAQGHPVNQGTFRIESRGRALLRCPFPGRSLSQAARLVHPLGELGQGHDLPGAPGQDRERQQRPAHQRFVRRAA